MCRKLLRRLADVYPDATTELEWSTPFQLLIAVMLSAQTTDKRVNMATKELFEMYPTPSALALAEQSKVEDMIYSLGLFRVKAAHVIATAKKLVEKHRSTVPTSMVDLLGLPGVARKTANVVLGTAFGIQKGVAVDTHVSRVALRLGLTGHTDPGKVEQDLMRKLPDREWTIIGHRLMWHGRRVCTAKKPSCSVCTLADLCPSKEST